MNDIAVRIAGTGSYLPKREVTNEEISPRLNSSPEWIFSHTGINSRHYAADDESAATLGAEAARAAMAAAGAKPDDIGLVICATTSPDYGIIPSTACLIQEALGCKAAGAFDLSAACSGFAYALAVGKAMVLANPAKKVLCIGTEVLTRSVDFSDRSIAMLFGDGAAAAVLEAAPRPADYFEGASILGSDGSGARFIVREGGLRLPLTPDRLNDTNRTMDVPYMSMDGHAVFAFAVKKLDEVIRKLCAQSGMKTDDLDLVFAHQANARIIEAVERRSGIPPAKFFLNLATVGNTSTASIPLCLDKAVREGALRDGMRIAMAGFGAGLTWAGLLMKWPYL